uniref:Bifunctional inhibitor/plant lipid transfer protein/seed storage helical domain-containing protein n=1 Tax=Ananas comosus var. bracteatus TaxID=296719 RepID=A0A6V7NTT8_ANACO|nr:unnamed protein product [Ananas comosus var. bracteatus]
MAGEKFICFLAFAIIILVIFDPARAEEACDGDIADLVHNCNQFVKKDGPKIPPSEECCAIIKKCNVPCVCSHITKDVEKIISMEKVAYVAECCNRPFAHGSKCGSYTVPKA